MPGRDFWSFGRPDDVDIETDAPPGYRFARGIPRGAPYGKQLSCRACGVVVAATDNAISRHKIFHERLANLQNNLGMNYSPDNPNRVEAVAQTAETQMEHVEIGPAPVL